VRTLYDGRLTRALDRAHLVVARGEFVAVTGPSSCCKSTLLRPLATLEWRSRCSTAQLDRMKHACLWVPKTPRALRSAWELGDSPITAAQAAVPTR